MNWISTEQQNTINNPYPLELYFGGTFNPVHFGHLQSALEICEQLKGQQVYLLPNFIPPHKASPDVNASQRAHMCELACQLDDKFKLDTRELRSVKPSYTIETLKNLRAEKPNVSLCFLIGMDSLQSLDTWQDWQQLTEYCHLVVASRGGYQAEFNENICRLLAQRQTQNPEDLLKQTSGFIYLATTSALMISASQIRQRYQQQQNCLCLLPENVNDYIINNHLYQR